MLAPKGVLFIGDVRSQPLFGKFHASVKLFQSDNRLSIGELKKQIYKAIIAENELLVNPCYFVDLEKKHKEIHQVCVIPKLANYVNEMSKYRYQVIISTRNPQPLDHVKFMVWKDIQSEELFQSLLKEGTEDIICIHHLPFDKLEQDNSAMDIINSKVHKIETVKELREMMIRKERFVPNSYYLMIENNDISYHAYILWETHDEYGTYDLLLLNKKRFNCRKTIDNYKIPKSWSVKDNHLNYFISPYLMKARRSMLQVLRNHLKKYAPVEMIPELFILEETRI